MTAANVTLLHENHYRFREKRLIFLDYDHLSQVRKPRCIEHLRNSDVLKCRKAVVIMTNTRIGVHTHSLFTKSQYSGM